MLSVTRYYYLPSIPSTLARLYALSSLLACYSALATMDATNVVAQEGEDVLMDTVEEGEEELVEGGDEGEELVEEGDELVEEGDEEKQEEEEEVAQEPEEEEKPAPAPTRPTRPSAAPARSAAPPARSAAPKASPPARAAPAAKPAVKAVAVKAEKPRPARAEQAACAMQAVLHPHLQCIADFVNAELATQGIQAAFTVEHMMEALNAPSPYGMDIVIQEKSGAKAKDEPDIVNGCQRLMGDKSKRKGEACGAKKPADSYYCEGCIKKPTFCQMVAEQLQEWNLTLAEATGGRLTAPPPKTVRGSKNQWSGANQWGQPPMQQYPPQQYMQQYPPQQYAPQQYQQSPPQQYQQSPPMSVAGAPQYQEEEQQYQAPARKQAVPTRVGQQRTLAPPMRRQTVGK